MSQPNQQQLLINTNRGAANVMAAAAGAIMSSIQSIEPGANYLHRVVVTRTLVKDEKNLEAPGTWTNKTTDHVIFCLEPRQVESPVTEDLFNPNRRPRRVGQIMLDRNSSILQALLFDRNGNPTELGRAVGTNEALFATLVQSLEKALVYGFNLGEKDWFAGTAGYKVHDREFVLFCRAAPLITEDGKKLSADELASRTRSDLRYPGPRTLPMICLGQLVINGQPRAVTAVMNFAEQYNPTRNVVIMDTKPGEEQEVTLDAWYGNITVQLQPDGQASFQRRMKSNLAFPNAPGILGSIYRHNVRQVVSASAQANFEGLITGEAAHANAVGSVNTATAVLKATDKTPKHSEEEIAAAIAGLGV